MSQEGIRRRDGDLFSDAGLDGFIARAFMRGAGHPLQAVTRRPVVGICSSWSELNPCNAGLHTLAGAVKRGVIASGGFPVVFPTISISEPFSRPSSMLLRNLMSMDVEQMILCSPIDTVVLLGGCDKTVPAQLMGAVSANLPALAVTAGPRPIGTWNGAPLTVDDLWTQAEQRRRGKVSDQDWQRLEGCLNGGYGTCNVMGTATTMAVIAEILGFALPGSALQPSQSSHRTAMAEEAGARAVAAAAGGTTALDLITRDSIEDAFRVVCAIGGSTNAFIHLTAIAGRAGVSVSLDDIDRWSQSTPVLTDLRPSGTHLLGELDEQGGVPALVRELAPLLHLQRPAACGRRWSDVIDALPTRQRNAVLHSLAEPMSAGGAITVLRGSLAPDGAVIKNSAADPRLTQHTGPALVFDGVEDMHARINDPRTDVDADTVLVLRGAGPRGGPGMPEVGHLPIPTRLLDAGITDMVRVSDARMSGTATGTVVLHVAPESAIGGPLAYVHDGDLISLDVSAGRLDLLVDQHQLASRTPATPAVDRPARGYNRLYDDHVTQASHGCDFDFLQHESLAVHRSSERRPKS